MEIRNKKDCKTTAWSGGTTTELFIYPEDSSFADREFDFRISTAVVESEQSDFTQFPGYDRILCVLEGQLRMIHTTSEEEKEVMLSPLEQDSFSGSWQTKGFGRVTDFNIIFRKGMTAALSVHRNTRLNLAGEQRWAFPLAEGLKINNITISKDQFAILEAKQTYSLDIPDECPVLIVVIHG